MHEWNLHKEKSLNPTSFPDLTKMIMTEEEPREQATYLAAAGRRGQARRPSAEERE